MTQQIPIALASQVKIFSATFTLTNEQITAPYVDGSIVLYELIPAPGTGKLIQCGAMIGLPDLVVRFNYFGGYTFDPENPPAPPRLYLLRGADASTSAIYSGLGTIFVNNHGATKILQAADCDFPEDTQSFEDEPFNKPILVGIENPPVGGDSRNRLAISTSYRIADLSA